MEPPQVVLLKKEAIDYVNEELERGCRLSDIKKALEEDGCPKKIIEFAFDYVKKNKEIKEKEEEKEAAGKREYEGGREFSVIVVGIIAIVLFLLVIFFFIGIGGENNVPEKIDIFLYDRLGISPEKQSIVGSAQIYSRNELMQEGVGEAVLNRNENNPALEGSKVSDTAEGINKIATVFDIREKSSGAVTKKTLVEIRLQSKKDMEIMKIVESVPKTVATYEEIRLTQGGAVAEKDPVLVFSFTNVKAGQVVKAAYVIDKNTESFKSTTFIAEKNEEAEKGYAELTCGDKVCVRGESYLSCCQDCGCLPGFVCENNICALPRDECMTDIDCDDSDAKTTDICLGKPKTCQHKRIFEEIPEQETETATETNQSEEYFIDCETDLNCLAEAAQNCTPASCTRTIAMELDGVIETDTEELEIIGTDEEKCTFFIQTERIEMSYNPELIAQKTSEGMTQEQMDTELEGLNSRADEYERVTGECKFDNAELTAMIERWAQEQFGENDFETGSCEGEYFEEAT